MVRRDALWNLRFYNVPDSMTEEEALRRALDRERARRRKAELLLEEKSRELFESFEELEKTYAVLKANQKQLVQSEKMASLGIMSAGVAHEINNPAGFALSNIRSLQESVPVIEAALSSSREFLTVTCAESEYADLASKIESDMVDAGIDYVVEDMPDLLKETSDGLVRITDIVSGLKTFARKDDSKRELVDINQIVRSALVMVRSSFPKDLTVLEEYADLPAMNANGTELSQVMFHLFRNAGEAIQHENIAAQQVSVETRLLDDAISIRVGDTGCGMAPEVLDKLFTPFFTTKDVGKGTGLGLSVSIGIVEEHGGHIDVASEAGEGAQFEVVLPLHSQTAIEAES